MPRREAGPDLSSIAMAPTLEAGAPLLQATLPAPAGERAAGAGASSIPPERYSGAALLGEGGMGKVVSARDLWIGREVAIKTLRGGAASGASMVARFLREARIQARLEHPAIVPVHEIGTGPNGDTFFTMKRVRGASLREILDRARGGEGGAGQKLPRHKLLTAFVQVCFAIELAHTQGIVHRDLKPENLMLGDFGEVYVLDWGIAKVLSAGEDDARSEVEGAQGTAYGAVLGTPGYMPPEQVTNARDVDGRADVFALGAILFEILTGRPMCGAGPTGDVIRRTMDGVPGRADELFAEGVAPELVVACVRATDPDPEGRTATARSLAEAVETYLEGERDVALRQQRAETHAARAEKVLAGAMSDAEARREAFREASSALALDPGQARAAGVLTKLLLAPPSTLPAEAEERLAERSETEARASLATISAAFASWWLFLPILWFFGIRSPAMAWVVAVASLVAPLTILAVARRGRPTRARIHAAMSVGSVAVGTLGLIAGPLVLAPVIACANALGFTLVPGTDRRVAAFIGATPVLGLYGLEAAGVLPPSAAVTAEGLVLLPRLVWVPSWIMPVLVVTTIAAIVIPSLTIARIRGSWEVAERRLFVSAWHLRQLLPDAARPSLDRMG